MNMNYLHNVHCNTPCSDPYWLVVTREGVSQVHMNGTKGKVLTNQTDVKTVDYHYRYVPSN